MTLLYIHFLLIKYNKSLIKVKINKKGIALELLDNPHIKQLMKLNNNKMRIF